VLHRSHAGVEDRVRTNKAMGLDNLPSASWEVNCGWMLAANLASDLDAWLRLLALSGHTVRRRAAAGSAAGRLPYHQGEVADELLPVLREFGLADPPGEERDRPFGHGAVIRIDGGQ
jgi:hypothetical protein